ncbi:unnamed protein product [Amoebophrya sp. A120]|nr:unnamed protein product [Amoebophrya sp. A120]|eukprot:GSA120T00020044001.1
MFQCLECDREKGYQPQLQLNNDVFDSEITLQANAGVSIGCGQYVEPVWTKELSMDYCLDKRLTFWKDWVADEKDHTAVMYNKFDGPSTAAQGAAGSDSSSSSSSTPTSITIKVKDIPFGPNAWDPAPVSQGKTAPTDESTGGSGPSTSGIAVAAPGAHGHHDDHVTHSPASADPKGHGGKEAVGTSFWDSIGFDKLSGLPVDLFDFLPQYFDPLANPSCKKNRRCERLVKRLKKLGIPQPDHCCPAKDWVYPTKQRGGSRSDFGADQHVDISDSSSAPSSSTSRELPSSNSWMQKKLADVSIKPYLPFLETYTVSHYLGDGEDTDEYAGSWRQQKEASKLPSNEMCNEPHPLVDWNFQHSGDDVDASTTNTRIQINQWSKSGSGDDNSIIPMLPKEVYDPAEEERQRSESENAKEAKRTEQVLDLSRLSMRQRAGLSESSIMNTRYTMDRKIMEKYYQAIAAGGYTSPAVRKFLSENYNHGVPDPVVNNMRRAKFPAADDFDNEYRLYFAGNYTPKLGLLVEKQMVRGDSNFMYLTSPDDESLPYIRSMELVEGQLYGQDTTVLRMKSFEHMYHACCYRQSNFMDRFVEPLAVSLFQYSSLLRTPIFSVLILLVNFGYLCLLVKRSRKYNKAQEATSKSTLAGASASTNAAAAGVEDSGDTTTFSGATTTSTSSSANNKTASNYYPDYYAQALSLLFAGYLISRQSKRQMSDHHTVVSSVPQPRYGISCGNAATFLNFPEICNADSP